MVSLTNSEDPDEMQHNAAFHQCLHCLLRLKKVRLATLTMLKPYSNCSKAVLLLWMFMLFMLRVYLCCADLSSWQPCDHLLGKGRSCVLCFLVFLPLFHIEFRVLYGT